MASIKYTLRNAPVYRAIIINNDEQTRIELSFDSKKFNRKIFARAEERFGKNSLICKSITNDINPDNATGSSSLFSIFSNEIWREEFPHQSLQSLITLDDIEDILSYNPNFFSGFYSAIPSVVLRTAKDESWQKNQRIIDYLLPQLKNKQAYFNPEDPLVITNPKIIKDKTEEDYGLLLEITENTVLTNDSRLASGNSTIKLGAVKKLWTKPTGLSRLCMGEDVLDSNGSNLEYSVSRGRVVLRDATGVESQKI